MDKIIATYKTWGEDEEPRRVTIVKVFEGGAVFIGPDGELHYGDLGEFTDCEVR